MPKHPSATNEVLSESHYYPFGMDMAGPWIDDASDTDNRYRYNGKELNDDFGLLYERRVEGLVLWPDILKGYIEVIRGR